MNLSLIVRIIIVKTQKNPKNIYQATVLPFTNENTTETNRFITSFICNNSNPKVKYVVACQK